MAKRPPDRYASCSELADDLRRWLNNEPIEARRVGIAERLVRWVRREPRVAGLAASVLLVLVGGIMVSTIFATRANQSAQKALAAQQTATANAQEATEAKALAEQRANDLQPALDEARRQRAEAERQQKRADDKAEKERLARAEAEATAARLERSLYASDMNLAQRNWDDANIAGVLRILMAHKPASGANDLRGWEWFYQWRLCHTDLRTLHGHGGNVYCVTFSPDGRRLASANSNGTVKLWDAESGTDLRTFKGHSDQVTRVAYSPDGKRLASASWDQTVKIWDAESGAELRTLKGHSGSVNSVAFSPDGWRLAAASDDKTVKIWDATILTPDEKMAQAD